MQNICKTGRSVATITARCGRMLTTLLIMLFITTSTWAQQLNPDWDRLVEILGWGYPGNDNGWILNEKPMAMSDFYQYHRPMGRIENIDIQHGYFIVSGWALDMDGDKRTSVTIILRQGGDQKYCFTTDTNIYRSSIEGNGYFRGLFGFCATYDVDPGTYEMYAFANNITPLYTATQPKARLPIGFMDQGYRGLDEDWKVAQGHETYYHKTITVLPYQYHVTFDINYEGGTNPPSIEVPDNTLVTLPFPTQSRDDYTFICWSKFRVYNESADVYAHWMKGKGTNENPYLVEDLDDWNRLCLMCIIDPQLKHTGLSTYSVVKLMADLTITKPLEGFIGEFDGGGHTITYNSNQSLFGLVSGAWIHDLKVQGTITGSTNASWIGGLVEDFSGRGFRNSYDGIIENVEVSVDFNTDINSYARVGGFIGIGRSGYHKNILMKNCVYNGRFPRHGKVGGGFIALTSPSDANVEFQNCLFAPKEMAIKPTYTFSGHYNESNGMYYTESGENVQGEQVFTDLPATGVYTPITLMDKEYLVAQNTVSITSNNTYYAYTGQPITVTYTVSRDGTPLSADDYTSVFRNEAGETMTSPQAIGAYRHEVTTNDKTYIRSIFVTAPLTQSEGVYQINSVADWMTFAADVAAGNTYSGSTVRLNADITTSAMVGTESHKFSGTFDGGGHTLTFNYHSALTVYDPTENFRAPFRYIDGATIHNLTVAGSTISTGRQMGGLVAYAAGNNSITDCTVVASLTSYLGGDASNGGFIAHVQDGSTTFSGCIFNGYLLGSHASGNGGFVGWSGGTLTFNDCLFNPIYVNMMDDSSCTIARSGGSSFNNTYYTTALGELQGTQAYGAPQSSLCDKHTMANGRAIYMVHSSAIEGLADTYAYNGGSDVTLDSYNVKYNGTTLSADKYTVTIRNSAGEEVSAPTAIGRYTLTATGNNSEDYYGAVSQDFWVMKTLATDASGFYQIADEDDWCSLDYYIQNTTNCKAKLTANIGSPEAPITTMLTDEDHHFNGVIDGDGHTLTVNLTGTGMAAPFLYVGNATFVNLNVAGTIRATNEGAFMGGIVALMLGNQNFVSCRSSVNIGCSDQGCAGGFVGYAATGSDHDITFRDCLFDGILSGQIDYSAGFVGYHHTEWPTTTLTLTNCLMNGTINNSKGVVMIASPFYSYPENTNQEYYVVENSYHKFETTPACYIFNDNQGSFTALAGTELQTLLGDGWIVDGSDEVVPKSDVLYTMNITVADGIAHGIVECQATGVPGFPVNLTLIPEGGYLPTSVSYNDGSDHPITPQDGSYSFIMPDADVTISVTFNLDPNAVGYIAYNTETKQYENRLHTSPTAIIDETTGETDEIIWGTIGNESWYIVNSNITISKRIYVNGTVHLILADGESLTAQTGITVSNGNKLYIYGQEAGTGALTATGAELGNGREAAAIGSEGQGPIVGEIAIHGGVINATGWAWTAAIGGGVNNGGGTISIYGGIIHAVTDAEHSGEAKAIGNGSGGGDSSKTIADGLRVYVGNSNTPVNSNNRVNSLSNKIVTVEPCTEHNYNNNVCTHCGLIHHYTLTYNGNGATSGSVPEPREYLIAGDRIATVSGNTGELERPGYTFAGWNTAADGSGTAYEPGDEFTISEMATLYAQWNIITYQIEYDLGGGMLPEGQSNPAEYTIESGNITLANPACEGRFFMGWAGTDINTTSTNVTIPHGSTGDRYYSAMWDDNNPPFAGMEIDHDYQAGQLGRFFVKMTAPEHESIEPKWGWIEDEGYEGWIYEIIPADEDFPVRTVNIPDGFNTSFKVYDNGGKSEFYYQTGGITTLILTAPEGKVFSVSGVIGISTWYDDWLKIYDSATADNEIEVQYALNEWGEKSDIIIPFVTTGNSIRIDLYNDPYNDLTNMGLDLNVTVTTPPVDITLSNNDSQSEQTNIDVITSNNGVYSNVTLEGRTLYKDGRWNTLCLPFDIDDISVTPLKGAILKTLASAAYNNNTDVLTINSTDAGSIEAGKPYLVKWEIPYTVTDGSNYYSYDFVDDNLVNGNKGWEWMPDEDNAFCEFQTSGTRQVIGYTLTTCLYMHSFNYNPKAWVLYGKLNENDEWTIIDSRNTTAEGNPEDALPTTDTTDKYYSVANPGIYRYFRFEVTIGTEEQYKNTRLGELTLHGEYTPEGDDLIQNPTFNYVTIKNELHPTITNEVFFAGHFGAVGHLDDVMLDEHDSDGDAMHSILSVVEPTAPTDHSFEGWCTDAGLTTPATTIPFDAATGNVTLYAKITENVLELANAADNSDNIQKAATNGGEYKVTLADRTLWKDGDWNTLCLPFNLTIAGSVLDGDNVDVRTLSSTGFDSSKGELTLTFTNKGEVTELAAGTPYIIKWSKTNESDPDLTNLVNPVFTNVTISNATANISTDYISFVGTYSSVVFDAGTAHKDVLFLGGGSSLYYPDGTSATTINACRGYFQLKGITAGDPNDPNAVKAFVLNFGDDETTDSLTPNPSPVREGSAGAWYDIQGRKLDGKPLQRGIYIHNGKKIVIK